MLILKFFSLKTCQCTQTHIRNRLCLYVGKPETLHQSFFSDGSGAAASHNLNHFVNVIQSNQQTL